MQHPPYDDSVFINCPFDSTYQKLFRAIVFAVADCGFFPRCVLEYPDSAEPRIEKLFRIISECRYGVHDISATDLDAKNNLPRFNMPLELGIFLGARKFGSSGQEIKSCIILDLERYRYQIFCSDIAGQDPRAHQGEPRQAIRCIRDWLQAERPDIRMPGGDKMFERYEQFQDDLPWLCETWELETDLLTFHDLIAVVDEWLELNEEFETGAGDLGD
jgi:hypothetical protein